MDIGLQKMKVKWLIAGAGDIVKSRAAAALAATDRAETVAIFARSVGKAEALAERFGIPRVYHDYGQALAESDADAVYIATPHSHHHVFAKLCIEHGRNILVEKAFTANALMASEVIALAYNGDRLIVGREVVSGWYEVRNSQISGYVAAEYIIVEE